MATLLLRLQGPMQAWGVQSRFGVRDTAREPSKSGVIGLLCAALGRKRSEPVDDLAALRMGIRVDKAGSVLMDFHTAKDVLKAGGGIKNTEISRRYYLADAAFLVGFESDDVSLLETLHTALHNPRWMLFLGRKSFVPSPPVYLPDGLRRNENMLTAFKTYPWLGVSEKEYRKLRRQANEQMRLMLEDENGEMLVNDFPISYAKRQFAPRRMSVAWIPWPPFAVEEVI
jgi:CRISPR system Cascade subunit CasD